MAASGFRANLLDQDQSFLNAVKLAINGNELVFRQPGKMLMKQDGTLDPRQYPPDTLIGMKNKDAIKRAKQKTNLDANLMNPGFPVIDNPVDMGVFLEEGFPSRINQQVDLDFRK